MTAEHRYSLYSFQVQLRLRWSTVSYGGSGIDVRLEHAVWVSSPGNSWEILGQPELTPFRLTNKEAEPIGTIFVFVRGCKKDSFTAL